MSEPAWMEAVRRAVDGALERLLPPPSRDASAPVDGDGDAESRLAGALRYAALGAGKRIRPALALAAHAAAGGGDDEEALGAAAAVELIHAYSLVHDDLPAMDDAELRRGRPTVHRAYGEATAILAGDALLTLAFGTLAEEGRRRGRAESYLAAVARLSRDAGAAGLVGGQALDLALPPGTTPPMSVLEHIHAGKTGALFAAAAALGGHAASAAADDVAALHRFGLAFGIAFQHADDLADGDRPGREAEVRERFAAHLESARREAERFAPRHERLLDLCAWLETLGSP